MKLIGVTGGIATGKTTVIDYLRKKGHAAIDCDEISKQLMKRGARGYRKFVREFGDKYLDADMQVDRVRLGRDVFTNRGIKAALERILHPLIFQEIAKRALLYALAGRTLVFIDVQLLFECKWERYFSKTVVVTCGPKTQRARLRARTDKRHEEERLGMSKEEVFTVYLRAIDAQYPIGEKRKRCDFVIDNNRSLRATYKQVDDVLSKCQPGAMHFALFYLLPLLAVLSSIALGAALAANRSGTIECLRLACKGSALCLERGCYAAYKHLHIISDSLKKSKGSGRAR